jgi:hypothetical protein
MMRIKKLSIPEPCHQSWQQMAAVNGGRHCESCCKTVVDFTLMNNDEIINYLSASKNVCGRFDAHQLTAVNLYLQAPKAQKKIWRYVKAVALIAGLFPFIRSEAQTRKIANHPKAKYISIKKDSTIRAIKPDSLIAKTLTADKINIDKRIKGVTETNIDASISKPLEGFLGSVAVGVTIVADGWRNSYLSWRALFRY